MADIDDLFKAIEDNDARKLKALLYRNPELVEARNYSKGYWFGDSSFTPLFVAALMGNRESVSFLLDRGAKVNEVTAEGNTALEIALTLGYLGIALLLIERGADGTVKNGRGTTPLHLLVDSCSRIDRKIPLLEILCKQGVVIDQKNDEGLTALEMAVISGQVELAVRLLECGASINTIHVAVAAGDIDRLRAILQENPHLVNEGDANTHTGESLLQKASYWGHKEIVELLISMGADVHAKDGHDESSLLRAATAEIAEIFLDHGLDACERNIDGLTPLHCARSIEIAELLVQHGADVTAGDNHDRTPLHGACSRDVAVFLVEHGADINAKEEYGRTPLHESSCREVAEFLIEQGADINAKSSNGWTPLDTALNDEEDEVAEYLISRGGVVSMIALEKGATCN